MKFKKKNTKIQMIILMSHISQANQMHGTETTWHVTDMNQLEAQDGDD